MKKSLIKVAEFDSFTEGELFRTKLRAQGITAVLVGSNKTTFGMVMGTLSRVSIFVPQAAVRRVERLIRIIGPTASMRPPACRSLQPHTPIRLPGRRQ
jgi:hypothetical protein